MSDEKDSGTQVPQATPVPGGAFDWLIESHQQSAPLAPLADDVPAPMAARPTFDLSDPVGSAVAPAPVAAVPPSMPAAWTPPPLRSEPLQQHSPVAPPVAVPPNTPAPVVPPATVQQSFAPPQFDPAPAIPPVASANLAPAFTSARPPGQQQGDGVFSFDAEPLAPTAFSAGPGAPAFALERRGTSTRSGNEPLDWVAFALAFLAPPIGFLLGIAAVISRSRSMGYAAGIAKAAIGIGAALSIVLGVAFAVVTKIGNDQAAHASIVASSSAWCTKLKSNPSTLASDTFGWPSPGDTIPASITRMKTYESYWESLATIAPTGIRSDTQKVVAAAKSIITTVQSTQTLNDSGNVAQMQNVVATSGIHSWVSTYCG